MTEKTDTLNELHATKPKRYVVVHGHFYQPPRENPWSGLVERNRETSPYHDWNEKISHECYIPNLAARIKNSAGKTIDIVNNYEYLNFDFGPTLFTWFEKKFPEEYKWLLDADRAGMEKRGGHGNAIAQAYHHTILPLADPRDRHTEVLWGLADFRRRFSREPEGIWLPETAVNEETLRLLVELKIKYTILSPAQALKVRRIGDIKWQDVNNDDIDPRQPYRYFVRDTKGKETGHIDLFFYHNNLSMRVSFENVLHDSVSFASLIEDAFDPESKLPQIISIATDGESFGHHQAFAEMGLGHLLKYELPKYGIEVTNFASFLELYPPEWEVQIKPGKNNKGTSWSCMHGVDRWQDDCGCHTPCLEGWNQKWRRPLRDALNLLRTRALETIQVRSNIYFDDLWNVRDEYVKILNSTEFSELDAFLTRHLKLPLTPESRIVSLKILETLRHALAMFTSCGWFFNDISGIETVENLRQAAGVIELVRGLTGVDLERGFVNVLKDAKSNIPEFGNGKAIWEKLVKPARVTPAQVAAQFVLLRLFASNPESRFGYFLVREKAYKRRRTMDIDFAISHLAIINNRIQKAFDLVVFLMHLPDHSVRVYVKEFEDESLLTSLEQEIERFSGESIMDGLAVMGRKYFGEAYLTMADIVPDYRQQIFNMMVREKMEKLEQAYELIYKEYFPLLNEFYELCLEIPEPLKTEISIVVGRRLIIELERLKEKFEYERFNMMEDLLNKIHRYQLDVYWTGVSGLLRSIMLEQVSEVEGALNIQTLGRLRDWVRLAKFVEDNYWRYETESRVFRLGSEKILPLVKGEVVPDKYENVQEMASIFTRILDLLDFTTDDYQKALQGMNE